MFTKNGILRSTNIQPPSHPMGRPKGEQLITERGTRYYNQPLTAKGLLPTTSGLIRIPDIWNCWRWNDATDESRTRSSPQASVLKLKYVGIGYIHISKWQPLQFVSLQITSIRYLRSLVAWIWRGFIFIRCTEDALRRGEEGGMFWFLLAGQQLGNMMTRPSSQGNLSRSLTEILSTLDSSHKVRVEEKSFLWWEGRYTDYELWIMEYGVCIVQFAVLDKYIQVQYIGTQDTGMYTICIVLVLRVVREKT